MDYFVSPAQVPQIARLLDLQQRVACSVRARARARARAGARARARGSISLISCTAHSSFFSTTGSEGESGEAGGEAGAEG